MDFQYFCRKLFYPHGIDLKQIHVLYRGKSYEKGEMWGKKRLINSNQGASIWTVHFKED